jgi:putative transposase
MEAAVGLSREVGLAPACRALSLSRATLYRARAASGKPSAPRPTPARALAPDERQTALEALNGERFCDMAPAAVHSVLLDEGTYICSVRTMYRILDAEGEVKERRDQLRHPVYSKPELLATRPREVWSWDITKLRGPAKWTYYYLYVILDIFSRYVVGWMIALREAASLAEKLISQTCEKQRIEKGQLTIHADRGSSMKSKPVELLLVDMGVDRTHSRPHTSNDNPYSESQFKTLKYRPEFPKRFGSIQDARAFSRGFFTWYNTEHRHSGIAYLTPEMVHYGYAADVLDARQTVLLGAYDAHPERFVNRTPAPLALPEEVWINRPERETEREVVLQ